MPIRAICTICSDFFDHFKDVAAIHCGHTFHLDCLTQWFQTAPNRTCPQCRVQVNKKTIIHKLFFDLVQEDENSLDAESLKNELEQNRAKLLEKEKEKRDCQSIIDSLRETLDMRNSTIESLHRTLGESEMLCSTLKKQMKYLEQQQDENQRAKEEACRLRNKMKTMERIEMLLQSQRPEVEEMIRDMGVGQSAVEQLAVYCVSLKKEYENLKVARKTSGDLADKLRKELISSKHKLRAAVHELDKTSEELKSTQKDLQTADKEILSLKKKLSVLQESLNLPSRTSETLSRLVLESPAPVGMPSLKLRRPSLGEDIDLNTTFNVDTPPPRPSGSQVISAKKIRLEKAHTLASELTTGVSGDPMEVSTEPSKMQDFKVSRPSLGGQHWAREPDDELVGRFPSFIKNAVMSKRFGSSSLLEPSKDRGAVRMGYDGLGGRTKYIQPTDPSTIRPLLCKSKVKRKVVSRPVASCQGKLDTFLSLSRFQPSWISSRLDCSQGKQ
ncbi:E3 ubiquitin-protein ligase TRAIP isoform X2 [Ornithorhynchus anatinus]|uniref:E3 ubiquitin-protein ligase TRAIP isoform X2 n=1 Tax=Ornithorhynchus anatinus TaxID=9258 RepID=UPI0010A7C69B|nr:E3 ubiquitin-protein ligase TRAIP isoform X2 [Ornithorhynchus anatinus]